MTLSKSQPWATLYQPRNLIPYFWPYSLAWRGNSVFMKNLKNASLPRRTQKYVERTGPTLFWHARLTVPGLGVRRVPAGLDLPVARPLVLDLPDRLGARPEWCAPG